MVIKEQDYYYIIIIIIFIVIKNKIIKECIIIDMDIPSERNTSVKVIGKLWKYKDLEIEINRMWGTKTTTIPMGI
jgi:hypothetical protein